MKGFRLFIDEAWFAPNVDRVLRRLSPVFAAIVLALVCFAASAYAEDGEAKPANLISQGTVEPESQEQAIASQLTDHQAATEMPHADLDRVEALRLMDAVFGAQLESPAGPFAHLQVDKFLSDNVAVVSSAAEFSPPGAEINAEDDRYRGRALIESTVPIRTEDENGQESAVDLGLEHEEGELQPANPLVEVGIPQELGDGVALADSGVQIELQSAPDQIAPSVFDESVAFYPNVATDTDLAVAPTPLGVETLTQIRSAAAPLSQTFHLNLPTGAELQSSPTGGAEVSDGSTTLINVLPASAIDASGKSVPTEMQVSGNTLTLSVNPGEDVSYPILLDPVYAPTYYWMAFKASTGIGTDWISQKVGTSMVGQNVGFGQPGLEVAVFGGTTVHLGDGVNWFYYVPRLAADKAQGFGTPTSWISSMSVQALLMSTSGGTSTPDHNYGPYLATGIWNESAQKFDAVYAHVGSEPDLSNAGTIYNFSAGNDHNAKAALGLALYADSNHTMTSNREVYAGGIALSIADEDLPTIGAVSGPTPWQNAAPTAPIEVTATDTGLGVKTLILEQKNKSGQVTSTVASTVSCAGSPSSPCPRTQTFKTTEYNPDTMTEGYNYVSVTPQDVVGNKAAKPATALVKVDHSGPSIALSGTMTEQAVVGKNLPQYLLKVNATDGTSGEFTSRSGVASITIEVDGKIVDATSPGCPTANCALSREWELKSAAYSVGQHAVVVTATDAVGMKTTKEFMIKLGTAPPPAVVTGLTANTNTTSGTLFGTVNPNGLDTTFHFDYGPTVSYGSKTPSVEPHAGWGNSPISVGGPLSNLTPNTVYHYRLVATNESGTSYGADRTLIADQAKPTMQFSSSYSSSSPTNYGLTVTAGDPGASYSGVKSVTVLLNGSTAATETFACPAARCPATGNFIWTHSFERPLNGSDRLTVLAVDDAGNATSASFDLPSKVVHATVYSANPASGGVKVADEWAQLGTHNSRRTTSADVITRGSGECQAESSTARCSFLRSLNASTENGEPQKYYSEVIAEMSEPTAISEAGTLLLPRQADFGQSVEKGTLSTVLQSWQTPPPGAGSSFEKVVSNSKGSEEDILPGEWSFWVDSSTGLPVKAVTKEGTQTPQAMYYSYESTVQEAATLSPEFFMQPPPTRESEGCKASGTIGGWSFNKMGMVYPEPTFNSLVVGDHGLVTLHPEGAAIDGYEKRSELTNAGVALSTNPADVGPITWEVTESPSQILEQSGESFVIETEGGSPSAVITSSTPQRMTVVKGVEEKVGQSGDKIVLEGEGEATASVQPIKNEPVDQKMLCITQGQIEHAVSVQEEALKARNEAMGAKASGGTKTTSVVVYINPHPAMSGVSVTDKYGACNTPHSKTFGSDGRVEFGECPVGKDVTLTVPSSVNSGGTTYNVPDSSRTFQPPAAGWTVQFNYNAQAVPPPPPGKKESWFTSLKNETVEESSEEAGASSEQPIPIPPGIGCVGVAGRPFKSDTHFAQLFTAEAWFRLRCRSEAAVVAWSASQSLYRFNKNTTPNWVIRQHKEEKGPGPAITNQGPYVISAECRGLDELLSEPVKAWKHVVAYTTVSDDPPGTESSAGEAKSKIHCG